MAKDDNKRGPSCRSNRGFVVQAGESKGGSTIQEEAPRSPKRAADSRVGFVLFSGELQIGEEMPQVPQGQSSPARLADDENLEPAKSRSAPRISPGLGISDLVLSAGRSLWHGIRSSLVGPWRTALRTPFFVLLFLSPVEAPNKQHYGVGPKQ